MKRPKVIYTSKRWIDALVKSIEKKWRGLATGEHTKEPNCALCSVASQYKSPCEICCPLGVYEGTTCIDADTAYDRWTDAVRCHGMHSVKAQKAAKGMLKTLRATLKICKIKPKRKAKGS